MGRSLSWTLFFAFAVLAVLPLAGVGIVITVQVEGIRQQAESTSTTYERRAQAIAEDVTRLLHRCEEDLRTLARLPRIGQSYAGFSQSRRSGIWVRAGTDANPSELKGAALLYREVGFADATGQEQTLVVWGQPVEPARLRNISDPAKTTFRSEDFFARTMALAPGQIHVGHLSGFHLTKIEQLGIDRIIGRLESQDERDRQIYRYLLVETMRVAGVYEYVGSFAEGERTVLVYRVPGETERILVDAPPRVTPEELHARELELNALIRKLQPEDTREGRRYQGVIRFSTPVHAQDGTVEGIVFLALDHAHLMERTQHIKAMERDATVFAGYRDADYSYLFDDQGWIITHPKFWNIRGVDRQGQEVPALAPSTTESQNLVGRGPVNLLALDWKMGEGYHEVVLETRAGKTATATSRNLSDIMRTRVYTPIFYSTGPYQETGVFGGVMMGTRVDKFIQQMRTISTGLANDTARLRKTLAAILSGVLLLVALLSLFMARWLVRPIKTLGVAARTIAAGDLRASIPAVRTAELGELAASFRAMQSTLLTNIEELENKNQALREAQDQLLRIEREKQERLQGELDQLREEVVRTSFAGMVAESPTMQKVLEEIVRVAHSSATVLILGENGVGKELVAEAIHKNSARKAERFVRINCAAFNDNLLESELFGHKKGAFTGALRDRRGLFEAAHGGTLLLDEIGEMSLEMQKRLLRTLQEGEVVPVGSNRVTQVDVRILAATNQDLQRAMREGRFREDLYHRVNVIAIQVPPLRERREDILPLARLFLDRFCAREAKPGLVIDEQVESFLLAHRWPGNIRELENAMERAVIRSRSQTLGLEDFQFALQAEGPGGSNPELGESMLPGQAMTMQELERFWILRVLKKHGGNKKATATELGIGYNTLWRKLKIYNGDDEGQA